MEMLRRPCIIRDAQTMGDKIRSGYLTPTFLRTHKWAEMLHHPAFSEVPQQRGTKPELGTSPLPSQGPTSVWESYVTPAFSGFPKNGD